jgi:katanin p80 WD40 repeat-containing subunit B1
LNFDFAAYSGGKLRIHANPSPMDSMSISLAHSSVITTLTSRLNGAKAVRAKANSEHGPKHAFEFTATLRNRALFVDMLKVFSVNPMYITLDISSIVLPWVQELLFEPFEEYEYNIFC